MNSLISIIIPCYNSEGTLQSTLKSVSDQSFQNWEAIIINDGSTDETEEIALKWSKVDKRFKYFSKQNEGLGKTRNFGIERAEGKYILPLDSDNLVGKDFVSAALKIFENNPEIGVVHGNAEYFGDRTGIWVMGKFDLQKMLVHNYIDACAIYKRDLWTAVGGYDEKMPHQGHEDWEFWLALGSLNVPFCYLNEITFKYFVSSTSMIRSFSKEMTIENQDYIVKKHSKLYHEEYCKSIVSRERIGKEFARKIKSKKFVINLFFDTFLGFKIFKIG
jgi:glycosyltransferase involved in cell wall biosynthesis